MKYTCTLRSNHHLKVKVGNYNNKLVEDDTCFTDGQICSWKESDERRIKDSEVDVIQIHT